MSDTATTPADTETNTSVDFAHIVDTHLEAYGEPDADRRIALIEQVWAPEGHLFDPPIDGAGHDGINEMFVTVQGMFPGHTLRRMTGVDSHHGIARYGWEMVSGDGTVALTGMDVAVINDAGKLTRIAGFFGELPALDA